MHERDQRPFRSAARLLVDQARAAGLELRHRRLNVVDPQRDVMQPRAALVHVARDRLVGRGRFEQLELRLADRDKMRADLLRGHLLRGFDLEAERVAVERERGSKVLHRDADVIENRSHRLGNVSFVLSCFRGKSVRCSK